MTGWRGLAAFWIGVAGVALAGAAVLAWLGPPPVARTAVMVATAGTAPPAHHIGEQVAVPDLLLMEPAPDFPGHMLPRIGLAGRRPGQYYAAWANAADPQIKVGLIVSGMGLNRADSRVAIDTLPPAVDLAFSPYAAAPDQLLSAARLAGHEVLLGLPLEPQGTPADDEGPHALLTTATPGENARNLEWALSRFGGYAGVIGLTDTHAGGRFAASPALMEAVGDQLTQRGLFYIDPRPDSVGPDRSLGTGVDILVDSEADAADMASMLAELEQAARAHGSAIGLVPRPTPAATRRIAAWAAGLDAHMISLIPVSALLQQPARGAP